MTYNFSDFKKKVGGVEDWLKKEYSALRSGRATPAILDTVMVDSYGTMMPISQVATISAEGPRSLRIAPWDSAQIKPIEKAITIASLGAAPVVDDKGIRLAFPEPTGERREEMKKLAKSKLEEARVRLRSERESVLKDFEKKEKATEMTKDDVFRSRTELQKIIDETNKKFEELLSKKEKEIME